MGEKRINGRKRHYLVDTEGHLLAVLVERADLADRAVAQWLFRAIDHRWTQLQKIWADQAYNGDLGEWLATVYGIELEVVERPAGQKGFAVLPRRWAVERTHAWITGHRRMSRDYERLPAHAEAMIKWAMIGLMARRLAPAPGRRPWQPARAT